MNWQVVSNIVLTIVGVLVAIYIWGEFRDIVIYKGVHRADPAVTYVPVDRDRDVSTRNNAPRQPRVEYIPQPQPEGGYRCEQNGVPGWCVD